MRGEVIRVHAPDVSLQRPTRLVHPRYPLYIAPKPGNVFVIGATEIESAVVLLGGVRALLAWLAAAYALDTASPYAPLLADAPPAADELAARQATLVGGFGRRLETTAGLAGVLASQWAAGRPLADLANHVPQLLAVTPAQVQDFARRHWQAGALRSVVVGDLSATGVALAASVSSGPGALRLRMADVDFEQPGLRKPR